MILASDFDNTIYVEDKNQLQENIKYIKLWMRENIFVITTGRSYYSIYPLLVKNNIPYNYLICNNGAMVFDANNNIIESNPLPQDEIEKIKKIILENNLSYILDKGMEYTTDFNVYPLMAIFIKRSSVENPTKIIDELNKNTKTYHYLSKNYISIENINIRKDKSLEKIGDYLEINKIHCIGDGLNDIDMIKKYNGGLMKNHEKELDVLENKIYDSLSSYIKELI